MIEIKGMNKLITKLQNMSKEGKERVKGTVEATAQDIEYNAKSFAPVDTGKLRQGINAEQTGELSWKVVAREPYSAYMEFGTGGLVNVPPELADIAIQYKGKGVRQINIAPRPYMYPAFLKGRIQFIKDLEQDLKDLTK